MKKILITNDDGYESPGLLALIDAVKPLGHVTVVAPASEKSACGHSLTLTRPLRFISIDDDFYKLDDGTPSDCIYLALHSLFDEYKPDLVLSGINKGSNMGEDLTYSGTASAAMEAILHGIPAIAFSQTHPNLCSQSPAWDFTLAQKIAYDLTQKVLNEGLPLQQRRFLNVNIPPVNDFKGYKVTRAGWRCYGNDAHCHHNPRGEEHYWLGLHPLDWRSQGYSHNQMTDFDAIADGFISVTPVQLDLTAYSDLQRLEQWI